MRWRFRGLKRAIVDKRWHTQDLTGFMYSEPAAFLVVLVGGLLFPIVPIYMAAHEEVTGFDRSQHKRWIQQPAQEISHETKRPPLLTKYTLVYSDGSREERTGKF